MLNLFKKKEVITYYEGDLSYKEIESRLTTEQTWGTDKKIYGLFFDHLKLKTPVLEFQSIIQEQLNQINKNSKLNQNKENPKKTLTCIKNKVGGIESVNCY